MWWKAWRESRGRFLAIALTLSTLCAAAVLVEPYIRNHDLIAFRARGSYTEYIYHLIYAGSAKGVFALLVIFLGLGGLQRERAHRTSVFTLALPVSRLRVIGTQIVIGTIELAVLALLPAILIPSTSALTHHSYPLSVALHFSVVWYFGGLVIFATSFLLSVLAPGEYAAPVACYLLLVLHTFVAAWRPLAGYRLNVMWIMGEFQNMHWNAAHTLLEPPTVSWSRMSGIALCAFLLFFAAIRVTQKQDF